jgi:hypothetical protein
MKTKRFHCMLIATATMFLCRLAQAGAQVEQQAAAMPYGNTLSEHPIASMVAHIIFLALIIGVGASVVTALFKSPIRQ